MVYECGDLLGEGERFPEINEMFYSRGPLKIRRCMRDFFETCFTEDQAQQLTRIMTAAIAGYRSDILMRPDKPGAAEREQFVDQLIAAIVWPEPREGCEAGTAQVAS
jgi:hypothetical protein